MPEDLYRRLARQIHTRIEDGDLKPGDPLSITVICRDTRCARPTVGRALQILEGDGLIARFPGLGYRVTAPAAPEALLYKRVAGQVREAIRTGNLLVGDEVVVRCLARAAGCHPATAGKAMRMLEREGWVSRAAGWGYLVGPVHHADAGNHRAGGG